MARSTPAVVAGATRSTARCSASSIPRPRRSNFTRPTAAQSSLSHWSTVRPAMRAHSTGQTSTTGRSQITIPPGWMPRWRGKPSSSVATASTLAGDAELARGLPGARFDGDVVTTGAAVAGSAGRTGPPAPPAAADRRAASPSAAALHHVQRSLRCGAAGWWAHRESSTGRSACPGVDLPGRVAERLAGVPDRRAGPVGDRRPPPGRRAPARSARRRTGSPPRAARTRCRCRCPAGRPARGTGSARTTGRATTASALVIPST